MGRGSAAGRVQGYIADHLADTQATLVLDDTQVIKKGTRPIGVARQHCGETGDVRSCQVLVMLTYAAEGGHTYDRTWFEAPLPGQQSRTETRDRAPVHRPRQTYPPCPISPRRLSRAAPPRPRSP
ncbi:transposase [Streptomyces violaceus]|uniref:transposase n=1 Tax=Streptomyces violaceus TaxID=1936 RepID=UPI0039A4EA39